MTTTHHCPKKSKGGCHPGKSPKGFPYCTTHQAYCAVCQDKPHLQGEGCLRCRNTKEMEKKRKHKAEQAKKDEQKEKTIQTKKDRKSAKSGKK